MNKYAVTNEEETVTIHVWAFDEEDAKHKAKRLTDSEEFQRVKQCPTF
jgi:hypothetical protein